LFPFRNIKEIENIAVSINEKGAPVKLKDIGDVKDSFMEAESYARFNSKQSVTVYIQKESMTNTVKVASNVLKVLDSFKKTLDKSTELLIVSDQSNSIKSSIASVQMTIIYGIILIIIILTNFLGKKQFTKIFSKSALILLILNLVIFYILGIPLDESRFFILGILLISIIISIFWCRDMFISYVVAFSIPISVCITFIFMYFEKMTLNVISLSGIVLGIGLLVDNSIVVLENFEQVKDKMPEKSLEEQLEISAKEMASSMIGGTLTTVVVFLPFFLLQKQTQLLYSGIAFTVITSLFASLFCALSLVPWMVFLLAKFNISKNKESKNIKIEFFDFLKKLNFKNKLKKIFYFNLFINFKIKINKNFISLKQKNKIFLFSIILICISAIALFLIYFKFSILISFYISIVFFLIIFGIFMLNSYNSSLYWCIKNRKIIISFIILLCIYAMSIFVFKLPKDFMASSEQNEFTIFVELASGVKLNISDEIVKKVEKNINEMKDIKPTIKNLSSRVEGWSSKIYVTLVPKSERKYSTQKVIDILRKRLKNIGEKYETFIHFSEPQNGKEIIVEVYGDDYQQLSSLAMTIASNMENIKGFNDIKVRYRPGQPELTVNLNQRKIAMLGMDNKEVAETFHAYIRGLRASSFYEKSEEIETIVRLKPEQCKKIEDFYNLLLITPDNFVINPKSIATIDFNTSPSEIWHRNKSRTIQVSANIKMSLDTSAIKCKEVIKKIKFPEGYYADIGGDYEDMKESNRSFWYAMIITVLLIFIVLASQFESYSQPFIIMITVLLSLIGAIVALALTNTIVTLGVLIGLLMLSGIVVNNGIMLVDKINVLKCFKKDFDITEIIIIASNERKRPIFMTTITTVLGLLPMALDKSDSAVLWSPMAITVIGGLFISTILTLFIVPAFYLLIYDFTNKCETKEKI
jgi:hydrophobic/amphiphilic exporter-1 (mainly G- bacteria), HAE1 family